MYFYVIVLLDQFIKIVANKNVWKSSLERSVFAQVASIDLNIEKNSFGILDASSIAMYLCLI
jgi:hypothetical protein